MDLKAKWIWKKQREKAAYNQTIMARKTFRVRSVTAARIAITADSWYRLSINGRWVNDGPCRSWPEHYQYDEIDVTAYINPGQTNTIEVIARFFGTGTFHQVPCQAGLLAQLEVLDDKGKLDRIVTDSSWSIAEAGMWQRNTPKVSIQMEPAEQYDARRESPLRFTKAHEVAGAWEGPWKDLHPRDVALLNRKPVGLKRFVEANTVARPCPSILAPVVRLLHPGRIEANQHTSHAHGIAALLKSPDARSVRILCDGYEVAVNGKRSEQHRFRLKSGTNLIFAMARVCFTHQKDMGLRFENIAGCRFINPQDADHDNPWVFIRFPESDFVTDDMVFPLHRDAGRDACAEAYQTRKARLFSRVKDRKTLLAELETSMRCVPAAEMLMADVHGDFMHRRVVKDDASRVENPAALMHQSPEVTTVFPSPEGDVELVYDLGEQCCGYYTFDLCAGAGSVVDISGVEYIREDGRIQHTGDNRNGLRYVCKEGHNRFTSLKRRSGRYLFITLREMTGPVQFRHLGVIESTYPVDAQGSFECSDPALTRIWECSARTLELCMEDTYTDCPLYEQTYWVGDARNEALFGFTAFGAVDLAKRCITLAGQSLGRYPLVGCQVPSGWDCILPAWSFLWGVSVWDYYFYTGDKKFVRQAWKWVMTNLRNARGMSDARGLFSAPYWNMFDWTPMDIEHRTVLHNSMLVVGAIDAAVKCGEVIGASARKHVAWLESYRAELVAAINALWDGRKKAYPDSIHNDGIISSVVSQHTSFLALLYDIVAAGNADAAVSNVLNPPQGMVKVGSPFAMMYLFEALEKLGYDDAVVDSILDIYQQMLDAGATTVWEMYDFYSMGSEFPTRSHCHAWSSAPVHFLNRIVLGIRQTEAGCASFIVSPRVNRHRWARGATATVHGPLRVRWEKNDGRLVVHIDAPKGVRVRFEPNETHKGLSVEVLGIPCRTRKS